MPDGPFSLDFAVRDYECDLQGIVNNAVYQHYLEHARHVFMKSRGVDFAELSRNGVNLVVVRIELDYLFPLASGDEFRVTIRLERVSRLRLGFLQEIIRIPDGKPILKARVVGTGINREGRPTVVPEVERLWNLEAPVPGESP